MTNLLLKACVVVRISNMKISRGHLADYIYLIVPFWYASAAYQASLVEPWFVFWRDAVEPKYPW